MARDDADEQQVTGIVEALSERRAVREVDPQVWRIDMGLDPSDDWAMARQALEQDLDAIGQDWRKVLRIEA